LSFVIVQPLADLLGKLLATDGGVSQSQVATIAYPLAGVIEYAIFLVGGNLLILLPLYFGIFKRILHIGKYDIVKEANLSAVKADAKAKKYDIKTNSRGQIKVQHSKTYF